MILTLAAVFVILSLASTFLAMAPNALLDAAKAADNDTDDFGAGFTEPVHDKLPDAEDGDAEDDPATAMFGIDPLAETKTDDTAASDEAQDAGDEDTADDAYEPSAGELEIANRMGIPSDEAKGYGSSSQLASAIVSAGRRAETNAPASKEADKPEVERFKLKSLEGFEDKDEDGEHKFTPEVRELVKEVRRLSEHIAPQEAQLETLRKENKALRDDSTVDRNAREMAAFDAEIAAMPKEVRSLLGEGRTENLKKSSPQAKLRGEMMAEIRLVRPGYRDQGVAEPTIGSMTKRAANIVLADHTRKLAQKELGAKVKKRAATTIAKPTSRQTVEIDPGKQVDAVAKAWAVSKGVPW